MSKQILALSQVKTDETIRVTLSPQEIAERKDIVTKTLQEMMDIEDRFKEVKAEHDERIKMRKDVIKKNMNDIKMGFVDKTLTVHNIADDKTYMIEFYDDNGKRVGARPMTLAERPSINFENQDA
jgi:hypothetical protein